MRPVQRWSPLLAALLITACRNDAPKAGPEVQIVQADAGGSELVLEGKRVALPDLDADPAKREARSEVGGKRAAYRTQTGAYRVVYVIGDTLFLGGTQADLDFAKAPDADHALGTMFEVAPARRMELLETVRRTGGEDGVVRLLVGAAGVEDTRWEDIAKKLPPPQATALKDGLASALAEGQSSVAVGRVAAFGNLADPKLAAQVAARARDTRLPAPTAALFLQALAPAEAAKAGCEILGRPLPKPNESSALVDAAFTAVRDGSCAAADAVAEAWLVRERCQPSVRCDAKGAPLSPATTSDQNEALCTLEQVKAAAPEPGRGPLFAYGILLAHGKVPEPFTTAHARRRYAIEQTDKVRCDDTAQRSDEVPTLPAGTPCHCDEPGLRYQACRAEREGAMQTGICRFLIDDKAKKLNKVTAAPNGTVE